MEKYLSIGEVSRLLDIPESTLRFWQDKGIFSVEKGENNYRQYTVYDLTNIAEIALLPQPWNARPADGTF